MDAKQLQIPMKGMRAKFTNPKTKREFVIENRGDGRLRVHSVQKR